MKRYTIIFSVLISTMIFVGGRSYADPVKLGAHHFFSSSFTNSSTPQVLVPASANVNGVIITTATANFSAGSVNFFVNYPDGSSIPIFFPQAAAATSQSLSGTLPYPIMLPAGVAFAAQAFGTSFAQVGITYDVL